VRNRALEHLAASILRLLQRASAPWALVQPSGLAGTVRQHCAESRSQELPRLAQLLLHGWDVARGATQPTSMAAHCEPGGLARARQPAC
jgi:hypothetical protein